MSISGVGFALCIRVVAGHVRHPVAHPTSLFFYSRHPLKFSVRQTGNYGRFTMSDAARAYIASVSPKSAKGPRATFGHAN